MTAFQAEGYGGGFAANFIMPPAAVASTSSIIIILTLVHPFATSWPSSPKGDARTLRDWLSVSYGMIRILVIGSLRSPPKGETAEWYMKYMTLCFSPQIPRFPLRGSPAKRERVYGAEHRFDTPSLSWPPIGGLCHFCFLPLDTLCSRRY